MFIQQSPSETFSRGKTFEGKLMGSVAEEGPHGVRNLYAVLFEEVSDMTRKYSDLKADFGSQEVTFETPALLKYVGKNEQLTADLGQSKVGNAEVSSSLSMFDNGLI